jgi:hypothetical protein
LTWLEKNPLILRKNNQLANLGSKICDREDRGRLYGFCHKEYLLILLPDGRSG